MVAGHQKRGECKYMQKPQCKICRRYGSKLFLKGERCVSTKCELIKRSYPPGMTKKRKGRGFSEYGKELAEKQKLKNWYNLSETQFKKYVKEVLSKRKKAENIEEMLINKIESRLDNVVFRLGFAPSRKEARQLVVHRHFLVNDKKVNFPSYFLKKGDKIKLSPELQKKNISQKFSSLLKKQQIPDWLKLNPEKFEGEIIGKPTLKTAFPPVEISTIFEYYSK